jgi:hypothetical protein
MHVFPSSSTYEASQGSGTSISRKRQWHRAARQVIEFSKRGKRDPEKLKSLVLNAIGR